MEPMPVETAAVTVKETKVFVKNEKVVSAGGNRRRGRKNSETSPTSKPDEAMGAADAEMLKAMEELNLPSCFGSSRSVNVNVNEASASAAAELVLASSYESVSSESSEPCTTGRGQHADGGHVVVHASSGIPILRSNRNLLWFGCFDEDYNLPFYFCEETQCSQWVAPEEGFIVPLNKHVAEAIAKDQNVLAKQLLPVTKNRYKYWGKRFSLFSKFEAGVSMNQQAWYSVTPEALAKHHAKKLAKYVTKGDRNNKNSLVVLDAFCGVGGNAIQFALSTKVSLVYACEIEQHTIRQAKSNAALYGADSKISFICSDFFHFIQSNRAAAAANSSSASGVGGSMVDILFLSPPWGGPLSSTKKRSSYSLEKFEDLPLDTCEMIRKCLEIARVVCLYLPKYTNMDELQRILTKANVYQYEVEQNYVQKQWVAISVYIRQQQQL
jgi:16S rRNA G966 N2-methylase RsmD